MAINRSLLIACAALLLLPGAAALAATASCLRCHPPHYREIGKCVGCHGGDDRSERLRIAHHDLIRGAFAWSGVPGAPPVARGQKLLEAFACRRCHTSGGRGGRLAGNLDRLPARTTPQELFEAIRSPALFMPDFRFDDRRLTDLVNAILAGGRERRVRGQEAPQVVHFVDDGRSGENVFEKRCGACHKALTERFGALGRGNIGPNLSGLFSAEYPATAPGNGRWTAVRLKKWLDNPRRIRSGTGMQPVPLEKEEFGKLLSILQGEAVRLPLP